MWIVLAALANPAWGDEPTPAIDCAAFPNEAETCRAAQIQLDALHAQIGELNCDKGGKKKRAACAIERDELIEQRDGLLKTWTPSEEDDEADTRAVAPAADAVAPEEAPDDGPEDDMEIEISDE